MSWRRAPAVAVAQQHDEVGARAELLAAGDLAQADVHRLLVERSFLADPPAQVDDLEARPMLLCKLRRRGKTRSCKALRSALRSLKVELTKMRNTRADWGMLPPQEPERLVIIPPW